MYKKKDQRATKSKLSKKKIRSNREEKLDDFQVKRLGLDSMASGSPSLFEPKSAVRSRFNFSHKTKYDRKKVLEMEGSSNIDDNSSTTRDRFSRSHEENIKELKSIELLLPSLVESLEKSEFSTDEDGSETDSDINEIDTDEENDADVIDRVILLIDERIFGISEKSTGEKMLIFTFLYMSFALFEKSQSLRYVVYSMLLALYVLYLHRIYCEDQKITKENIIAKQKTFLHKRVGSGYVYTPAKPTKDQRKTFKQMREQEAKAQIKALSKHISYLNETYADNDATNKKIMANAGTNRQQLLPVQNDALKNYERQACSNRSSSLHVVPFPKKELIRSNDEADCDI